MALEIAQMYHLRWEIELGFKEIETMLLERREALRSQSPAGVQQEMAGIFVAYNLIRCEMYVIAKQHNVPASRISFTAALQMVHTFFIGHRCKRLPRKLFLKIFCGPANSPETCDFRLDVPRERRRDG